MELMQWGLFACVRVSACLLDVYYMCDYVCVSMCVLPPVCVLPVFYLCLYVCPVCVLPVRVPVFCVCPTCVLCVSYLCSMHVIVFWGLCIPALHVYTQSTPPGLHPLTSPMHPLTSPMHPLPPNAGPAGAVQPRVTGCVPGLAAGWGTGGRGAGPGGRVGGLGFSNL